MSKVQYLEAAIAFVFSALKYFHQKDAYILVNGTAPSPKPKSSTPSGKGLIRPVGYGVDASYPQTISAWKCHKDKGAIRAIMQCYEAQCTSTGGGIRPSCLSNYRNAISAGFEYIDIYFQPCTGSPYLCKPPSQQIKELVNYVKTNSMKVNKYWLDLEKDATCTSSWNAGTAANLLLAQEFAGAAKDSGVNWGIYSTPGEWTQLFGSTTPIVDNTMDLWYAGYSGDPSMDDYLLTPFGGFSKPVGKQYAENVETCGSFDLDYFNK